MAVAVQVQPAQAVQPSAHMPEEAPVEAALPDGFVYLDEALPEIPYDAKYATSDNFTGDVVPGYDANRIVVSQKMVDKLRKAQALAQRLGYSLFVWDAARPQRAVDAFVEWAKQPEDFSTKAAHYPNLEKQDLFPGFIAKKSGHTRGAAVDLTLIDGAGEPLDMGGGFDLMDTRSTLQARGLTRAQAKNRKTLRKLMKQAGFRPYDQEWWHFSLKEEPFPDQYFDFVICARSSAS